MVYLSSTAVYGEGSASATGTMHPAPRSAYGHSKRRGETHMERLMNGRAVNVLRLGNVYGPGRSVRFDAVINRFLFEAHHKGRITVSGSGHQQRPFIHVDAVVATLKALAHGELPSGTYDLVEQSLSVLDRVEALREAHASMEVIFVEQHVDLLSLEVPRDARLAGFQPVRMHDLASDLRTFASQFAW